MKVSGMHFFQHCKQIDVPMAGANKREMLGFLGNIVESASLTSVQKQMLTLINCMSILSFHDSQISASSVKLSDFPFFLKDI